MAPSIEQRTRLLRDFFVGRRDTFTEQQLPDAPKPYLAIKKELIDPELMAHCRGEKTISSYLVDDQGNTPVAVLDIDAKEEPTQQIISFALGWLKGYGLKGLVEPSGRKGYHIWIIFKSRLPAAKAKRLLEALMADWSGTWDRWAQAEKKPFPFPVVDKDKSQGPLLVDFEGKEVRLPFLVEINPKQDSKTTKEAPGNCVKLPWGKHRITDRWTAFMDDKGEIPEDWGISAILQAPAVTDSQLDEILKKYPVETKKQSQRDKLVTKETRTEEFNSLAVSMIMEACEFLKHCAQDAASLGRNHWWSAVQLLAPFGDAGAVKIHEISRLYPKYSEKETDQYLSNADKARARDIGPHTCQYIQSDLGFKCGLRCQAYPLQALSPAGLACKLATQTLVLRRTRSVTISVDSKGKQNITVNCPRLADEIRTDFVFRAIKDTEELWVYKDGVFVTLGECIVKEQVAYRLLELTTRNRTAEVLHYVVINSYVAREEFDHDPYILNLENGLLDMRTMELKPHTPDYPSTIRIPVTYKPDAECPRVTRFWQDVVGTDNVPLIEELFGFCLAPDYSIHRAFLFVGDGANGKSSMVELLRRFLGEKNCSTVPLQAFETNRFVSSLLWSKLANLYADLPTTSIQHTGRFKMLTGGDTVPAEEKYRSQFSFKNRAKLVFSANKPPKIENEDSFAFWRRWIIVNFPNEFVQNRADKNLLAKLTVQKELSGVLNAALAGLKRLWLNGEFTYLASVNDVTEQYMKASNPIYAFLQDCCVLSAGIEHWVSKDDLYDAFKAFCMANKLPVMGKESFGRALKNCPEASSVKSRRHRVMGTLTYGWEGLELVNEKIEGTREKEEPGEEPEAGLTDGPEDIPF
jgi:P4 family phage/plasmid primase-like protien